MKSVSTLAIALALSVGGFTMVAAPGTAVAKEKAADASGAPKVTLSDGVRKVAPALQDALTKKDYAAVATQLAAAEPLAQNDDDRYWLASVKLQVGVNTHDNTALAQALDVLIANPKTPAAALPNYTYYRGSLAVEAKQPAQAIPLLLKARELGSTQADIPIQLAQAYAQTNNNTAAVAEIDKAITAETAAGRKAPDAWYNFAFSNVYNGGNLPI